MAALASFSPVVYRDEKWLLSYPLTIDTILDYFSSSPFHRMSQVGLDTGVEYGLRLSGNEGAGLFVIEKRRRHGPLPTDVIVSDLYYCLDGSVYQCPDLETLLRARLQQSAIHMGRALDALSREGQDKRLKKMEPVSGPPPSGDFIWRSVVPYYAGAQ